MQPSKTVIIDLDQSEEELLSRMHHKTRYNIKVAEGHRVRVVESNDADLFLKLLKKTAKRDKFSAHPEDYYRKLLRSYSLKTQLFLAYNDKKPVAGAITLTYRDATYYLHGASDYDSRTLMAPYALHWYIITSNQKLGTRNYDLWGIDTRKWPGVTRFKLGWGGRTVEYPGSFDLVISRFWYLVYKVAKRII
jgi:lipid II:glycine glycyltransferase (peptidoglycan interpeptide bridge formation enzyme)